MITPSNKQKYLIEDSDNHEVCDINDLINWMTENDSFTDKSINNVSIKTLELLLDRGYLKENDRLEFKYTHELKTDKKKGYCTLVIQNGKPKVKWDYDDNIYSISPLTKQLLLETNRIVSSTNPDGNDYWRLEGSEITSLYALYRNIKKDDEDRTIKLF